ncbi:50S ribosomal protein L24 [Anaerohalosphaera lusitana]|uniref:Large ribosomal subunit protein uL24 n=1 Tax=Anaerohalosphaera lusitana TaxID=1936003 RepID=A0A1U9NPH7_9BACT|nr:50S ribosomal protein L24 [Anaerohalosphaera lusitana]AQT69842.1 50S ribosomal protein L24 [Anaerohalosphaera lusitana]
MARHIRKGDSVEIIAGEHKGQVGKVLKVIPEKDRVIVEGHNLAYKHVRPSQRHPQGGRIRVEQPIHISNVLPVDPKTNKGTRVRFEVGSKGEKKRVSVAGNEIGAVGKSKSKK